MFGKITNYIKETRAELEHVNWPTKKQIVNSTLLVIGVAICTAILLGAFDAIFAKLLLKFIS